MGGMTYSATSWVGNDMNKTYLYCLVLRLMIGLLMEPGEGKHTQIIRQTNKHTEQLMVSTIKDVG